MARWLVGKVWARAEFVLWSLRNPGRPFKDFYADSIACAFANRKQHASLGPNLKPGSARRSKGTFDWLLKQGVQPHDVVVDYGCGTLRIGAYFIQYLDADCYVGMDIDDRILSVGRSLLPRALLESKRPTLEVISPQSIDCIVARAPKWVFSKGVVQHIPPDDLHDYFLNISRLVHAGATGFFRTRTAPVAKRISTKTWVHGVGQLKAIALCYGIALRRVDAQRSIFKLTPADRGDSVPNFKSVKESYAKMSVNP